MTDEEIRDELMTALVAGHETTASSLAFAFEQLARAPRGPGAAGRRPDDDAYLDATINESCAGGRCCPTPSRGWSSRR